jgi:hypothetical protein
MSRGNTNPVWWMLATPFLSGVQGSGKLDMDSTFLLPVHFLFIPPEVQIFYSFEY